MITGAPELKSKWTFRISLEFVLPLLMMVIVGLCPLATLGNDNSAGDGFSRLMESFARTKERRARFVEERHASVLETPLTLTGHVYYLAPSLLRKVTETPYWERLSLDGETLRIEGEPGVRVLRLDEAPVVRALVESIRAIMSGDHLTLQRHYEIGYSGSSEQWRLRLNPREPEVRTFVEGIWISGSGVRIGTIEIRESNGDRNIMRLRTE